MSVRTSSRISPPAELVDASLSARETPETFMATIRQALEHVNDPDWLKAHSPLESASLLNPALSEHDAALAAPNTGLKAVDARVAALWQTWQQRNKTTTQALLWSAVRQLAAEKAGYHAAVLTLTYFQPQPPRPNDLINDLAVGKSTYYRHLESAVAALEQVLIAHLRPSLKLEQPIPRALVGRDALIDACFEQLRHGRLVALIGPSGMGKTALGAALSQRWNAQHGGAFWFTVRPGLNDNVQQFVYALAFFLHEHGFPQLWLHLIANPRDVSPAKAMDMIRKGLEQLGDRPPLLVIDEADLLLPSDLDDDTQRAYLRAFLDDLAHTQRDGAPLLLIGQRLLTEPAQGCIFELDRLADGDVRALLENAGFVLDAAALDGAMRHTRGNPLLLQLLIALHRLDEPLANSLMRLSTPASLAWFLARVRRHLSAEEQSVLEALCVHETPAPAALWRKQQPALARLAQLSLIDEHAGGRVLMPVTLRGALYNSLPALAKEHAHLTAARALAGRGSVTLAAHHFVAAGHPVMAIWTWHSRATTEVRQGQGTTALGIFQAIEAHTLNDDKDRKALALILGSLYSLVGKHDEGLAALDDVSWQRPTISTARAKEIRAGMLAMRGDLEHATRTYRESLDTFTEVNLSQGINTRIAYARQLAFRMRDLDQSRHEAIRALNESELLIGRIELQTGNYTHARQRFERALNSAEAIANPFCLALTHEAFGFLEVQLLNIDAAVHHFFEAGKQHQAYGNLLCAHGMTTNNIAFALLAGRRYAEAVPHAEAALAYFEGTRQPYWQSLSAGNLAEAYAHLNRLDEAESLLWRALSLEEESCRSFLMLTLALARRKQAHWGEAATIAIEALGGAEREQDLALQAQAWFEIGEIRAARGDVPKASEAFLRAAELFDAAGMAREAARARESAAGNGVIVDSEQR
jgi:tetratricopeptide (TPR) repeat protein